MTLLGRIDAWATESPDRIAHRSSGRTLTYAGLRAASDALAARLAMRLPDDGSPVAVVGHKEPEMLIAFVACAKAGHPYVPIDTAMPAQRIARIVELAAAPLTLTPETVAELSTGVLTAPPRAQSSGDGRYIIFTSGTTGDPKGVVITAGCLDAFLEWFEAEQDFRAGAETFLNQTTFSFDLSVMEIWPALASGATIESLTREELDDATRLYARLAAASPTVWVSTPSFFRLCLAERRFGREMLPHVRRLIFCGEVLPPSVAAAALERFPDAAVWNTYGPTEATVACTSIRLDRALLDRYPQLPIGRPMPSGRTFVAGDHGAPVADGEFGELVIAGPNVSPGYFGCPDLTARAFFTLDGMRAYRTGDRGHVTDGLLFCDGRLDRQIKLHGYRIELGDIEAHLCALPGVRDAVVFPEFRGETAIALQAVLLADGPELPAPADAAATVRAQLAERLPQHMLPRRIRFVSELPMTPNAKVDRQRVADMLR